MIAMQSQTELDPVTIPINRTVSIKQRTNNALFAYRLMIAYRFLLAILGGYLLATLSAMSIAQAFAYDRANAALSATLLAFCIYCGAFIWVFMVKKTLKATLGILIPLLVLYAIWKLIGN